MVAPSGKKENGTNEETMYLSGRGMGTRSRQATLSLQSSVDGSQQQNCYFEYDFLESL